MKKFIKRMAITVVTLLALIGATGLTAYAAGYINWGGTTDYELTLEHLENIEQVDQEKETELNNLIDERANLITEYEDLVAEYENTSRDNEQLNNQVLDLENQINALEQEITALEDRIEDGQTTRDQLGQAEKDMSHVEERSREVLEGME